MLNLNELKDYTGYSKSHLYKLTSNKSIPHYKPAKRKLFFKKEEIDQWLQNNKIE